MCEQNNFLYEKFITTDTTEPCQQNFSEVAFVQVVGFRCGTVNNSENDNSWNCQEGSCEEGSKEFVNIGEDLKVVLDEYKDFRINSQWDTVKSRSTEYTQLHSSHSYNSCQSSYSSSFSSSYIGAENLNIIGNQQVQENTCGTVIENSKMQKEKQIETKESEKKVCEEDKNVGNIADRFTDDSSSCTSSEGDSDGGSSQESGKSQAIEIPSQNRISFCEGVDFESRGLMTAMLDNLVRATDSWEDGNVHRVVDNYSNGEKLTVAETNLGLALMKVQELYDHLGQLTVENEELKKEVVIKHQGQSNIQREQAESYESQILQLQEELHYYRQTYEDVEEIATSQQQQIQNLENQVHKLTGANQSLQQNLSQKENINLQMHNQNDELTCKMENIKQIENSNQQQIIMDLESEIKKQLFLQERHKVDMEYLNSKQLLLEEENKKLRDQFLDLKKIQESSIPVEPVIRSVVDFFIEGIFNLGEKLLEITNQSFKYVFMHV